jgi:hypothetical protein
MSPSKVSPADFQVLKVVGQGAFGKVGSRNWTGRRLKSQPTRMAVSAVRQYPASSDVLRQVRGSRGAVHAAAGVSSAEA